MPSLSEYIEEIPEFRPQKVFNQLDSKLFNEKFMSCVQDLLEDLELRATHISIDGKTLLRTKSYLHLVLVVASELGLGLEQVKTTEKSNEITAIPEIFI